jgi:chitin disaccharide deacetylase
MLIVNADDLGRNQAATDAILSCQAQRRITCASAMVFMADSERAAQLALGSGLETGLHLNLSERFSADGVPARLRAAHDSVRRFLTAGKYALLVYNPFLSARLRLVFDAQYAEFLRLYGRPPSHLDGHQHMHLATNLLVQRILPAGAKVRRSFSFLPGEKSALNRRYRAFVDRRLARRHRLTDRFFSLAQHLTRDRLERIIALAGAENVELMAHPALPREFEFMMSASYGEAISRVRLGGYDAL